MPQLSFAERKQQRKDARELRLARKLWRDGVHVETIARRYGLPVCTIEEKITKAREIHGWFKPRAKPPKAPAVKYEKRELSPKLMREIFEKVFNGEKIPKIALSTRIPIKEICKLCRDVIIEDYLTKGDDYVIEKRGISKSLVEEICGKIKLAERGIVLGLSVPKVVEIHKVGKHDILLSRILSIIIRKKIIFDKKTYRELAQELGIYEEEVMEIFARSN